ncbi:MAG: 50S ribosomal protein L11 [Candidatus Nitrosocaldus sp.]|nr:50S ribosomal protein L11 [Candidatus Nitrosocaldus sp.]MDW8000264.1 50S ribosomal protein L11 [Candidatus Nitrosocaldus sp.]
MGEKKILSLLVTGGEANAGPPLGPSLGPLGVNILAVVNAINERTREYAGMKVPVKVEVDVESKEFTIDVGIPPTAMLIMKEAGISKGSGKVGHEYVGDISMDKVIKVARLKMNSSYARSLKSAVKEVIGACVSLGVTVDGKKPKDMLKAIDEGRVELG